MAFRYSFTALSDVVKWEEISSDLPKFSVSRCWHGAQCAFSVLKRSESQKAVLEKAKGELRKSFGKT
jgi:hypothetical protein